MLFDLTYLIIVTLYGGYDLHNQAIPFASSQECERIARTVSDWNFDPNVIVTVSCIPQ